jgi:hypothetical protein
MVAGVSLTPTSLLEFVWNTIHVGCSLVQKQDQVMHSPHQLVWEPPTYRQESGQGLVTWKPSSDATVDWLPSNQLVTEQWTVYLATAT